MKVCTRCKTLLPYDCFAIAKGKKTGYSSHCKECHRASRLWRLYRITPEDYDRMLAEQGGHCAFCPATQNDWGGPLCVDHCHTTGKARRLLCTGCNSGYGGMKESPDAILKAYHAALHDAAHRESVKCSE